MTSRMHVKSRGSAGKGAYALKGAALRVMVGSRPKLVFDLMTVPGIMDVCCMQLLRFLHAVTFSQNVISPISQQQQQQQSSLDQSRSCFCHT
jgi:hypothetical protein